MCVLFVPVPSSTIIAGDWCCDSLDYQMPRLTKNSQSVSHDELSQDSRYIVQLMNEKFDSMSEE